MFACIYEGQLALKLPEEIANTARTSEEIEDFRPQGRPRMKEWVQFDFGSEGDLRQHEDLINSALAYAESRTEDTGEKS